MRHSLRVLKTTPSWAQYEGAAHTGIILFMARISTDEVARVAAARIALTPEEITRIAGELDVITEAVAKGSEVATPDVPATSHSVVERVA